MNLGSRPRVGPSDDLTRILSLPRRPPVDLEGVRGAALVELMTERLGRGPRVCKCRELGRRCINQLKPIQAWALYEAPLAGGLLAPISVGSGKTALDILTPLVMPNCRQAVLLIPPGLVDQLRAEYLAWREHFRVPSIVYPDGRGGQIVPGAPVVHVLPFSKFSRAESTAALENLRPDLIIIDEAHRARHAGTATTGRILRYFARHPETRLCAWSGTLTSKSIKDYSHLSAFALREGSPLPLDPQVVNEWAMAIDPSDWPAPMGALSKLAEPGEHVYQAFHRRLVSTRGVVATKAGAISASIVLSERPAPAMPEALKKMLADVRKTQARPDGEELVDATAVARCARELGSGMFYRWRFPRGEPVELIERWFSARKAWHKELREKLQDRREHLDSPLLCAKAAIRHSQCQQCKGTGRFGRGFTCLPCEGTGRGGLPYKGDLPTWHASTWPEWRDIRDAVYHETESVWVSTFLAEDAAKWALKHRGIVWYEHAAFGAKVAELAGLPLHGGGPDAEEKIRAEKGDRSIVASIAAHGTGRDGLQYLFSEQLVANPPSSGGTWEQLLGRLARIGQTADEIQTYVFRHTSEFADAIDRAVELSKYIQGTTGSLQRLLAADLTFSIDRKETVM